MKFVTLRKTWQTLLQMSQQCKAAFGIRRWCLTIMHFLRSHFINWHTIVYLDCEHLWFSAYTRDDLSWHIFLSFLSFRSHLMPRYRLKHIAGIRKSPKKIHLTPRFTPRAVTHYLLYFCIYELFVSPWLSRCFPPVCFCIFLNICWTLFTIIHPYYRYSSTDRCRLSQSKIYIG